MDLLPPQGMSLGSYRHFASGDGIRGTGLATRAVRRALLEFGNSFHNQNLIKPNVVSETSQKAICPSRVTSCRAFPVKYFIDLEPNEPDFQTDHCDGSKALIRYYSQTLHRSDGEKIDMGLTDSERWYIMANCEYRLKTFKDRQTVLTDREKTDNP
jgi:hypothetical protein